MAHQGHTDELLVFVVDQEIPMSLCAQEEGQRVGGGGRAGSGTSGCVFLWELGESDGNNDHRERASTLAEVVVREVGRQAQDPDCRVSVGEPGEQAAIF